MIGKGTLTSFHLSNLNFYLFHFVFTYDLLQMRICLPTPNNNQRRSRVQFSYQMRCHWHHWISRSERRDLQCTLMMAWPVPVTVNGTIRKTWGWWQSWVVWRSCLAFSVSEILYFLKLGFVSSDYYRVGYDKFAFHPNYYATEGWQAQRKSYC